MIFKLGILFRKCYINVDEPQALKNKHPKQRTLVHEEIWNKWVDISMGLRYFSL